MRRAIRDSASGAVSTAYYTPEPTSSADLALMRRIDELHLEHPFAGSRMLSTICSDWKAGQSEESMCGR